MIGMLVVIGAMTFLVCCFFIGLSVADALWFSLTYTWMVYKTHQCSLLPLGWFGVCQFGGRLFTLNRASVTGVTLGPYSCKYPFGWVRKDRR